MPAATETPRRYIRDLKPSERFSGSFSIANAQLGRTRQDKPYLRCLLGDRTGELAARMWSIDEPTYRRLPTDGFVYVEGETQAYQGDLQLIIHAIDPIEPTPEQMTDLMPVSTRDPEVMFAEVVELLGTLHHPAMKAMAQAYLTDDYLMSLFKRCPAAKSMHHAWLGGLLEHTLNLLKLGDLVCPLYPKINRDLVMMGLFVHDMGKTRELIYDRAFAYSDRGELIGHIVDGAVMVRDKALQVMREQGLRLPAGAVMVLEHIVLSHHGVHEFGSPKLPATPEAMLVAMLDNLDAKTAMCLAAARGEKQGDGLGGNFTEKQWATGTKIYRPDPLA